MIEQKASVRVSPVHDTVAYLWRVICLDAPVRRRRDALVLFLSGLAVILVCSLTVLPRMGGTVFFSWNSANYIASANEYLENDFGPHLTAAYTQSFGNISALPFNFHLQPEARLAFRGGRIDPVLFYTVTAILFYVCTFATGVTFGLGAWTSTVAGIVFPLLTMPYTSPPWYTESFWWHMPIFVPIIYMWTTLVITYYLLGRLDGWRNVLIVALLNVVIIWSMLAYAKIVFVLYMTVALFCVLFTLGSESWKELGWKVGGTVFTIVVVATLGPIDFLRGLYGHASNALFTTDYLKAGWDLSAMFGGFFYPLSKWREGLFGLNLIWVKYHLGYSLAVLSILGAAWVLVKPKQVRGARLLAAGALLTYPYSFEAVYGSPVAAAVYHVLVLFAVILVLDLADMAWRALSRFNPRLPEAAPRFLTVLGLATVVLALVFNLHKIHAAEGMGYSYPPHRSPLIAFLESEVRFGIGDRFRGRYLNMEVFPDTLPDNSDNWVAVASSGEKIRMTAYAFMQQSERTAVQERNDYFLPGPRYFNIPATVEYNRWATPVSVVFLRYLFGDKNEEDRIDLRIVSHFEPRLLRMLGIRYVLSARPLPGDGISLAFPEPVKSLSNARLYELSDTNIGQYSPTEVRISHDFRETLRILADKGFDPGRTIVLHGNVPAVDNVQRVERVEVTRIPDGVRVVAKSGGRSVVLLPFEFSSCLEQEVVSGSNVRVERANLMLTSLQFDRSADVRLRFRFGPFTNSRCRLQDMADIRALGLTAAGLEALVLERPGQFRYGGLW